MSQLQVVQVRRVSALGNWNDVIDRGGERMRVAIGKINRFTAYSANGLGL